MAESRSEVWETTSKMVVIWKVVLYLNIICFTAVCKTESSYLALLQPGKGSQGTWCMNTDDLVDWSPQYVLLRRSFEAILMLKWYRGLWNPCDRNFLKTGQENICLKWPRSFGYCSIEDEPLRTVYLAWILSHAPQRPFLLVFGLCLFLKFVLNRFGVSCTHAAAVGWM